MRQRVLAVRLDSDGDVLTAGPAIRAAAASGAVSLLCGPAGEQAARMLPGVDEVSVWDCPWISASPGEVDPAAVDSIVAWAARRRFTAALVLTSFHQSPLPVALLLRLAGVGRIAAVSADYPGSLLDVRLRPGSDVEELLPEPERAVAVARAAGFELPPGDDGALRVRGAQPVDLPGPYVVVHPGATAPARTWPPRRCAEAVAALAGRGWRVVVTGSPAERELTARVAGEHGMDLGGRTTYPQLAGVLAGAEAVVVGNTGPAHLAAAVGAPVVSLFSPVVPAAKWAPYRARTVLLGDQDAPCAGTRARECPVPGHPCLDGVTADDVVAAVDALVGVAA